MGVSVTAYTVVGVKIPGNKCNKITIVKAFPHNYPECWKVDPVTGAKLWKKENNFLINASCYFEDGDDEDEEQPQNDLVYIENEDMDNIFVGHIIEGDKKEEFTSLNLLNFKKIESELKLMLEPNDLWNEKEFGIYTFLLYA